MSSAEYESNNEDSSKKSNFRLILLIAIIAAVVVVVIVVVVVLVVVLTKNDNDDDSSSSKSSTVTVTISNGSSSASVSYGYANLVTSDTSYTESATFSSATADQVVFLVTAGTLTLDGSASGVSITVSKSGDGSNSASRMNQGAPPEAGGGGGTSSASDSYSFYGTNSAIVIAGSSAKGVLTSITISTSSTYSNAVVCTSQGEVRVTDCIITTTGSSNARGLHATYGGTITASGTSITTQGGSCATLATDRGGGSITATLMKLQTGTTTTGAGSPLIYSTGSITVTSSNGTSNYAQMVVIEGKNAVSLTNCSFTAVGTGNRGDGTSKVDSCGIMIYQSQSGDADSGTSELTVADSNFTLSGSYPFIFATNTNGSLTMSNCSCVYPSGQYFLYATETDEWGTSGSNGANITYALTTHTSTTTTAYKQGSSTLTAASGTECTLTVTSASSASSAHTNTHHLQNQQERENKILQDDQLQKRTIRFQNVLPPQ